MLSNALKLLPLALVATVALAATGCAVDPASEGNEDEPSIGGTDSGEDGDNEVVSERQLYGTELPEKTFVLTFDDGPGPRTAELSDYLADQNIHGTFFMNGRNYGGRQSQIAKVVARGHLLANHSQNHLQLTKLSSDKLVSEIRQTDDIIKALQPAGPFIVRAPFGAWNGTVARNLNATDMKKYVGSVFWEVGGQLTANAAADWDCWGKGYSVERCAELYLKEARAKKRGIILIHDVHNKSVDMTKYIVPKLLAEGYKFAKLTDVPSVKRAIGAVADASPDKCFSSTLGRNVNENACVQSKRDDKWYRCVDAEWKGVSSGTDASCKGSFPIVP
jgi:peptidoglycan/xylan/chitin deacetylase (PgdA/CDA1 family)